MLIICIFISHNLKYKLVLLSILFYYYLIIILRTRKLYYLDLSFIFSNQTEYKNNTISREKLSNLASSSFSHINSNYNDNLLQNKSHDSVKEIKISVILPVKNGGKYLCYSLRSVQMQKMKEIEIIIIDDNSSDDSLKIIKNYSKYDSRIRIIENRDDREILYSKSIGALNAKGKYILELDQDDLFTSDEGFNILYDEAVKNDLDLIRFQHISGESIFSNPYKITNHKQKESLIYQPELKQNIFDNYTHLLWGFLIKTELYKKTIYYIWPIIMNYKIIFQEDFIVTFFILIYAKNCLFLNKVFYFHLINKISPSNDHLSKDVYYLSILFSINIFYDYYIDYHPEDISILIHYINFLDKTLIKAKTLYSKYFNYIFGKIISNKYILHESKEFIMKKYNIIKKCDYYEYLNLNQKLTKKKSIEYNRNKKISSPKLSIIIISSYYKDIINAMNIIKSQNLEDFEIILIYNDDKISDYKIIENYSKLSLTIKLVNSQEKIGMLKSICKGVLLAKGKYILIYNPFGNFISNDSLQHLYNVIEENELDILEFDLYKRISNNYLFLYLCHHLLSQFNLTSIRYNLDSKDSDSHKEIIINKLIKTEFFQKIISHYKFDDFTERIDIYYNEILDYSFESTPHKFSHISSVKLYINETYYDKIKIKLFSNRESKLINETIFYLNFIFDNSKNTFEAKEKVLNQYINLLSIIYNNYTYITELSFNLFQKFINDKYISKDKKNVLRFYYDSLIN